MPPPALFLYGDRSPAVPKEGIPEVAAANRRAKIVEIADAGHMIPWDNLAAFLRQIRAFGNPGV